MLTRFHGAVVEVEDFDVAVEHYRTLLGREPSGIERDPGSGATRAQFALAHMTLEIRARVAASEAGEGLRTLRLEAEPDADLGAWFAQRGIQTLEATREVAEDPDRGTGRAWTRWPIDPVSSRGIGIEVVQATSGEALGAATACVEPSATVSDLDHVVIFSAHAEATRDFYLEGLGIRLALDKTFEERQVRLLFFRLAGVTIEIGSRLAAEPGAADEDRFGGLAWEVVDVDAIRERLLGAKFDVSQVRKGHKAGTRVCTVRAPVHGVPTLLIEPATR